MQYRNYTFFFKKKNLKYTSFKVYPHHSNYPQKAHENSKESPCAGDPPIQTQRHATTSRVTTVTFTIVNNRKQMTEKQQNYSQLPPISLYFAFFTKNKQVGSMGVNCCWKLPITSDL